MVTKQKLYIFFLELGTLLRSGYSILDALESLKERRLFGGALADDIQRILDGIQGGWTLSEALGETRTIPLLYINMLRAAELSGKLPENCLKVAATLKRWMVLQKRIMLALVYPFVLIHIAFFAFEAALMIEKGAQDYFKTVFSQIFLFYCGLGIAFAFYRIIQSSNKALGWLDEIVYLIPWVKTMIRDFQLNKFYIGFYSLYDAGHPMGRAFRESSTLISNHAVRALMAPILTRIQNDETLADALKSNALFPHVDVDLMITGEKTGNLDGQLAELLTHYDERIETHLQVLEKYIPFVIYILIMIMVGYKIVRFYQEYYMKVFEFMDD